MSSGQQHYKYGSTTWKLKSKGVIWKNQNMLDKQWQLQNPSLEKLSRGNLMDRGAGGIQ